MTRSIVLTLCLLAHASHAVPPAQVPAPATARIRGRVLDLATGKPLRHALVRIGSPTTRTSRTSETDDLGRYELTALPPGRYHLGAEKDAYLPVAYGQTRPFRSGKWIELHDGDAIDAIDFNLPRGGIVSGHIVDEYGDPAPNIEVRALRSIIVQGRQSLTDEASGTTDDRGAYRLYGLPPARYVVSAAAPHAPREDPSAPKADDDDRGVADAGEYAPTYYPGTSNALEGQPVTLAVGETRAGLDFRIVPVHTAQVSGTVLDSKGQPLKGDVEAFPVSTTFGDRTPGSVRPDGSFVINGLPPGDYQLYAFVSASDPKESETASMLITVAGRDIANLRMTTAPPVHISGRIVLDAVGTPSVAPSAFHLTLTTAAVGLRSIGRGLGESPVVRDDWTFVALAMPGVNDFRYSSLPAGWSLKAVRVDGVDVTDIGIDCKPQHDVRGVEIEVTNHPATLSGTVVTDRGEPLKDYIVIVFAQDEQRWTPRSRYVLTTPADQDGRFTLIVPPRADYLAIALDDVDQDAWTDPEFLRRICDRATPFSLTEGETRTLTLKLVTEP